MKIISKYFVDMKKKIILYKRTKKSSTGKAMTEVVLKEVINNFPKIKYLIFYNVHHRFYLMLILKNLKNFLIKVLTVFFWEYYQTVYLEKKNKTINQLIITFKRPTRQRHDGLIIENGSFMLLKQKGFLKNNSRLFGNIDVIYLVSIDL